VVWNDTDVHVLIVEELRGGIAQVLKVGGLGRACTTKRTEWKKEHPKPHPCMNRTRKGRPPEVI
jgi:hypothetical protein